MEVLKRLEASGLRLRKDKCYFQHPRIVYLGHAIDKDGLHPIEAKIQAIKYAPKPKNITQLRFFIGLIIITTNFSQTSLPLSVLYIPFLTRIGTGTRASINKKLFKLLKLLYSLILYWSTMTCKSHSSWLAKHLITALVLYFPTLSMSNKRNQLPTFISYLICF